MADDKDNTPKTPSMQVETRVGREPVRSIELGMPLADGSKPTVKSNDSVGHTAEFDDDGVHVHASDKDPQNRNPKDKTDGDGLEEGTETDKGGSNGEGQGTEGGEGEAPSLPDFKADDPEVVSKYEAAYITESGEPNLEALSASWFANAKVNDKGKWEGELPAGAYEFLESKGFSKSMVKSVEQGQMALLTQRQDAIFTRAGGADKYQEALKWARDGGYTDAQKQRFNDDVVGGTDDNLRGDQIDLLMTRWGTATGNGKRPGPKTQVNPPRSASSNAGQGGSGGSPGGAKPYANHAEWQADVRKARLTNDQNLLNESRKRLKVSQWYNGGGAA